MNTVLIGSRTAASGRGLGGPILWVGTVIGGLIVAGVAFVWQRTGETKKVNDLASGGQVRRVSGDHLKLKDGRGVEFAGIRLPYEHEPEAAQAREVLTKWVEDEGVRLRFDEYSRGDDERITAYVYANDTLINERLVREGLAFVKLRNGHRAMAEALLAAQAEAHAEKKGIWQSLEWTAEGILVSQSDRGTFHRLDCEKLRSPGAERVNLEGTAKAFQQGLAPCGKCRPADG